MLRLNFHIFSARTQTRAQQVVDGVELSTVPPGPNPIKKFERKFTLLVI